MGALARVRHTLWLFRTLPSGARRWFVLRLMEGQASRQRRLEAALGQQDARLVFVCHGNIMRSAFAEHVARAVVPHRAHDIASSGTHAKTGREAEKTAQATARFLGYDLQSHRASSFRDIQLATSDLIVCMDRDNEARVLQFLGQGQRVFLVGDIDELQAAPGGSVNGAKDGAGHGPASAGGETHPDGEIEPLERDESREVPDPYGKGADVTGRAFLRLRSRGELWARRHFSHA